jgi:hypothetical protein
MATSQRTLQETTTNLSGDEVLARAKSFFANRPSIYATFLDKDGPGFASFRGQGGEELIIGVAPSGTEGTEGTEGGTRVTGSSYLFDMQVSRFFSTLTPASPS